MVILGQRMLIYNELQKWSFSRLLSYTFDLIFALSSPMDVLDLSERAETLIRGNFEKSHWFPFFVKQDFLIRPQKPILKVGTWRGQIRLIQRYCFSSAFMSPPQLQVHAQEFVELWACFYHPFSVPSRPGVIFPGDIYGKPPKSFPFYDWFLIYLYDELHLSFSHSHCIDIDSSLLSIPPAESFSSYNGLGIQPPHLSTYRSFHLLYDHADSQTRESRQTVDYVLCDISAWHNVQHNSPEQNRALCNQKPCNPLWSFLYSLTFSGSRWQGFFIFNFFTNAFTL